MSSEYPKALIMPLFALTVQQSWTWKRLDEISTIFDCPHSTPQLVSDLQTPYIARSQDIRTGVFLLNQAARVSNETYVERIKRAIPEYGDLLYSREGTYFGIAAEVPKAIEVCLGQRMVLIKPKHAVINHSFLMYWLNSPQVSSHINGFRDGTVAERLNLPTIRGLAVAFPPLEVQKNIASILTCIESRISLLRETNTTLEAIAQTLFKSWFVDFDPVKAKAEGCLPEGMDEATAALFPNEFEESALGLIPKGWRVGMLGDIARLHKGSINPLHHQNTVFEHYSLPSFDNGQSPVMEAGIEIKSNKTSVPKNAVLLSKLNPHIPRVWLPSKIGDNAVCSTEFLVFVPADGASKEQVYCTFIAGSFQSSLLQLVTGTSNSHQRVKPDTVSALPMVIPSSDIQKVFEAVAKPLFARVGHNRQKAQTLTTLRDTLLPRLISGQLRLKQAREIMDEVGA